MKDDKEWYLHRTISNASEASGYSEYRCLSNPLEKKFLDVWREYNNRGHTLEYLLSESNDYIDSTMTDRDAVVAATVIQWLGSPVGQGFLRDIMETAPSAYFRAVSPRTNTL